MDLTLNQHPDDFAEAAALTEDLPMDITVDELGDALTEESTVTSAADDEADMEALDALDPRRDSGDTFPESSLQVLRIRICHNIGWKCSVGYFRRRQQ